jgi:transposase-like protein
MGRRKRTEEQQARRALISELLSAANVQSMDDIQELFKETIAEFVEVSLESELDNELGYEPYDVKNKPQTTVVTGTARKLCVQVWAK